MDEAASRKTSQRPPLFQYDFVAEDALS